MEDLVGQTLVNKYFLREIIGHGATSDVYLAWDKLRASELAIKVLKQELVGITKFLGMFRNEADFMRKLTHDNIVPFHDSGEERIHGKKIVFIAMKYIKGVSLRNLIKDNRGGQPLGLFEVSQILAAVCKALNFAHKSKVLHGDIKAANILISQIENNYISEKGVFLTDFGGSRLRREQDGGGTPAYMAPELFNGGVVTERTDIYALGVTLYEMLSGQLPFRGDSSGHGRTTSRARIAWEKINKPLPPLQQFNPDLPTSVTAVVEKALNKDPKLRHASVIDIFNEFEYARNLNSAPPDSDKIVNVETPSMQIDHATPQPTPQKKIPHVQKFSEVEEYCLIGIKGEMKGRKVSIPALNEEFIIGRSKNSDLRLTDHAISRIHASITLVDNSYYLRDEKSIAGTYLNGRRVTPLRKLLLEDGDQIGISLLHVFEIRLKGINL